MAACGRRIAVLAEPSCLSPRRRSDLLPQEDFRRRRAASPPSQPLRKEVFLSVKISPDIFRSVVGTVRRKEEIRVWASAVGEKSIGDGDHEQRKENKELLAAAVVTVALATGNRVFYKLALIPLRNYPFFLAQIATFGYVLVYSSILYSRYKSGIVTDKMLSLPKGPYAVLGFLETISAVSGMAAAAVLPGPLIPILSQTFLVWQLILSRMILKRRYSFSQVAGCCLVSVGVIVTVMSGTSSSVTFHGMEIFWSILMINSFLFQAADTVAKEIIFENSAKKLKGGSIDIFVVNSFASAFQALFTFLLIPFLAKLWGISLNQLPTYVIDGAACFLNMGSLSRGCEGAPLLPMMFVMVNMAFNISILHLVKISSGVVSCLASTFSVPLAIYVFTLPLPYVGAPSPLPSSFLAGATILVSGLLLYSFNPSLPQTSSV